jgi:4-amino-4-deoxy-L-arabinose transferase-like glycosyltransferase
MTWIAAVLSALLVAALAFRHFGSGRAALIGLLLFVTMPVVWSGVRDASPYLGLLPLAVAWLVATTEYLATRGRPWIVAAGVALSAMLYVHAAGVIMAPLYAAITLATLIAYRHSVAAMALFATGCTAAAAPWLVSILRDSSSLIAGIKAHGLYDADRFNLLQGGREMTSWLGLTVRSEVYWDSFNPAFLFLGPGGLVESVLRPQVFWLPLIVPLLLGFRAYAKGPNRAADWIILASFVAAPAVAALLAQPPVAARLLLMAPAAAMIATRPFSRRA